MSRAGGADIVKISGVYGPFVMSLDMASAVGEVRCWACDSLILLLRPYLLRDIVGVGTVCVHYGDCPSMGGGGE